MRLNHWNFGTRTALDAGTGVILWAALLSAALVALACGSGSGGQQIYFTSSRDGNLEVYSLDPRSGTAQNVTNSTRDERTPAISPDGRLLAFLSVTFEDSAILVVDRKGETKSKLATSEGKYRDPRWAPSSDRIAFILDAPEGPRLYIAGMNGDLPALLTNVPGDEIGGWSPNGETVIFAVHKGRSKGIYTRNPDGVNEFRLTDTPDRNPTWSPDSKRIAFLSTRDGNLELYVMNTDGSEQVRLTENAAPDYDLAWSPDGRRLAFVSEQEGNAEIYVVDIEKRAQTRLTYNQVRDERPIWSPDGRRIVFVSYLDNDAELFVMNADGFSQKRLTNNEVQDMDPDW